MTVLIWVILGYVFIKCGSWVLAPFRSKQEEDEDEDDYESENHVEIHIHISDSFNYHSSDSQYKGGNTYHDNQTNSQTDEEAYHANDKLYTVYKDAIDKHRKDDGNSRL